MESPNNKEMFETRYKENKGLNGMKSLIFIIEQQKKCK